VVPRVHPRRGAAAGVGPGDARNLADGSVEVLAAGDNAAIDALQRWLQRGPPLARVDEVARFDANAAAVAGAGFTTG